VLLLLLLTLVVAPAVAVIVIVVGCGVEMGEEKDDCEREGRRVLYS